MNLDWLYGPRMTETAGTYQLRSLTLEPDTVVEVRDMLAAQFPFVEVTHNTGPSIMLGQTKPFDLAELTTVADWERRNLVLVGFEDRQTRGHAIEVSLYATHPAGVRIQDPLNDWNRTAPGGKAYGELVRDLATKLASEGKPRLRWQQTTPVLPSIFWILVAASGLWVAIAETPPLSGVVFGALVVLALIVPAFMFSKRLRELYVHVHPGNTVRTLSRAAVRQQRADRHANLKLAAVTLPVGALLGVVGTLLTKYAA